MSGTPRAASATAKRKPGDAAAFQLRRRKMRGGPIPNNATRRAQSPHPPASVEMQYVVALQRDADRFTKAVSAALMPYVHLFSHESYGERQDAKPAESLTPEEAAALLAHHMKRARKAAKDIFDEPEVSEAAKKAGERTWKHSQREFKRLGIDIRKGEPKLVPVIDEFRKENVSLITKMHETQLDKIENILKEGWGIRAESLVSDIHEVVGGQTRRRAELIARDQVLSLNAAITKHRQKKAGIHKYVWTTVQDERVRPEHVELEGETFSWDGEGDPEEGHPGEAINCRCVAYPVLDNDFLSDD